MIATSVQSDMDIPIADYKNTHCWKKQQGWRKSDAKASKTTYPRAFTSHWSESASNVEAHDMKGAYRFLAMLD